MARARLPRSAGSQPELRALYGFAKTGKTELLLTRDMIFLLAARGTPHCSLACVLVLFIYLLAFLLHLASLGALHECTLP